VQSGEADGGVTRQTSLRIRLKAYLKF